MVAYTHYQTFIGNILDKVIDAFGTTGSVDVFKAIIHTDAPVPASDSVLGDLTQIAGSNGYTTDGNDIVLQSTRATTIVTASSVDVVWTASGGNLGASTTGRYVSYYDSTPAIKYLAASWDYGSTFTVATGETFTLDFGTTLWTLTGT